jgi:hypothetical protein
VGAASVIAAALLAFVLARVPSLVFEAERSVPVSGPAPRVEFSSSGELFITTVKNRCVASARWRPGHGSDGGEVETRVFDLDKAGAGMLFSGSLERYLAEDGGNCVVTAPEPVFGFSEDHTLFAWAQNGGVHITAGSDGQSAAKGLQVTELALSDGDSVTDLALIESRVLAAMLTSGDGERLWLRDLSQKVQEEKGSPFAAEGWRIGKRRGSFLTLASDPAHEIGVIRWSGQGFHMDVLSILDVETPVGSSLGLSSDGCVAGVSQFLTDIAVWCSDEPALRSAHGGILNRIVAFLSRDELVAGGEYAGLRYVSFDPPRTVDIELASPDRIVDLDAWRGRIAYATTGSVVIGSLGERLKWDLERLSLIVGALALVIALLTLYFPR